MTVEFMRALDRGDVFGICNDADDALVAPGTAADGAYLSIGIVLTDSAEVYGTFRAHDGVGKRGRVLVGKREKMKGETLGGFASNARKSREFFYQYFERVRKIAHVYPPDGCGLEGFIPSAALCAPRGQLPRPQ